MSSVARKQASSIEVANTETAKSRRVAQLDDPVVLTDIYRDDVNVAVWQRELPEDLTAAVDDLLTANPTFRSSMSVTPQSALSSVSGVLACPVLSEDVAELVDMFCCLFDLKRAGLRLTALSSAMCPRFHVDNVPCRLITTYRGAATQWLPHNVVDRSKLGAGNKGLPDEESGLYQTKQDVKQLTSGDVALAKGELWEGNENAGLVHRSPALAANERRLLLTLDFMSE